MLILTALRYEADVIARALHMNRDAIRLHVIGPGGPFLPTAEDVADCDCLMMAGLAGALDPSLKAGEVVIDESSAVDLITGPWRRGRIHTTDRIIATPADKAALFISTGAAIVDMEHARARLFADSLGLPFIGIRAISDTADETLDPATATWVTPRGDLRPGSVLASVCRRPWLIPMLLRLRRRSNFALRNLADAIAGIVVGCPPARAEKEPA